MYPRCLDQNVPDLDVGQLELFLRCLNVKYARRLQNFTNASRSRKSAMFAFHKPVLSLARPNFLTGAIIETRFLASLLAPPPCTYPTYMRNMFTFRTTYYNLRGNYILTLLVPKTTTCGLPSFSYHVVKQ